MPIRLKPLSEQTIVITGASSGIGLCTARLAARQGAQVFLIARDEDGLQKICDQIQGEGGCAAYAIADVANEDALRAAANLCVEVFGGFDTWVNNAGASVYERVLETPLAEVRRVFDTNFFGMLNGSRLAVAEMRRKGGALINMGSVLSDVGLPIQGIYSASKHAVKGMTDALRRELLAERAPVSVTLVKPSAIDTPYPVNAVTHIGGEPVHTAPVYAPEVVARAILHCASHPVREIGIGAAAYLYPAFDRMVPRTQDWILSKMMMERSQRKPGGRQRRKRSGLFHAGQHSGEVTGNYEGHVLQSSVTTEIALRPRLSSLALMGLAGAGIYALWRARRDFLSGLSESGATRLPRAS